MPFYQKRELIEQFPHRWEVVENEESLLIRESLLEEIEIISVAIPGDQNIP